MQRGYIKYFIFFLLPLAFSCNESLVNPDEILYGAEYYPLEKGRFYIYNVDSIEYKNGSINPSGNFQIKEVLADTFYTGKLLQYRVERFKRDSSSLSDPVWPAQPDSVWAVYLYNNQIIKTENNVRLVKLVFPIQENKKWNGNAFNNRGNEDYEMKDIGKSFVLDSTFTNTLIVEQANDTANIVRSDYRIEVFAKGLGMILKQREVYDFEQNPSTNKIKFRGEICRKTGCIWARSKFILSFLTIVSIGQFYFAINANAQTKYKFIIYFTDKINSPFSTNSPEQFLSLRSIQRRNKQAIPFTIFDLPVNPFYVDSLRKKGADVWYTSRWFNAAVVSVDSGQLAVIKSLPFVKNSDKVARKGKVNQVDYFDIDNLLAPQKINTNYGASFNQVSMIGADVMHSEGYHGEGMLIAILDAGFPNAQSLSFLDSLFKNKQVIKTYDFVERKENVYGFDAHGINVLSTLGAHAEGNLIGTAYKADYLLLRTEDAATEKIIEEVNWLIGAEYADSAGADLINSSLGYNTFDDTNTSHSYKDLDGNTTIITKAADRAAATGMIVVNSAGNEGTHNWKYIDAPADADSILAVGAVDATGAYASFSSIGPSFDGRVKPDVVAQGQAAVIGDPDGSIRSGSGTSFSGPIVCGMVAGFWQANPKLTNMQVINCIRRSGSIYSNPNEKLGYGIPHYSRAKLIASVSKEQLGLFKILSYPQSGDLILVNEYRNAGEELSLKIFDLTGKLIYNNEIKIEVEKLKLKFLFIIILPDFILSIFQENVSIRN